MTMGTCPPHGGKRSAHAHTQTPILCPFVRAVSLARHYGATFVHALLKVSQAAKRPKCYDFRHRKDWIVPRKQLKGTSVNDFRESSSRVFSIGEGVRESSSRAHL